MLEFCNQSWFCRATTSLHIRHDERADRAVIAAAPRRVLATALSADEHNLAAGSRFKDLFMRAGRLGEWQFLAHDGAQRAIFEPRNESGVDVRLFGGCNVPKRERANRGAAHHKFTRIDGDLAPIANNDHAPIFGQKFCVVGEIYVGEHFENDVHSAVACRFQNFFLISGFMVIENLVRSLSLCYSRPVGVPAVPKIMRPILRAICTAAIPTPPLAPCTRTVSEACAFAEWYSA